SLALGVDARTAAATWPRECSRVESHHLPTGTVAAHEHSEQSLARHLRRAEEIADEAAAAEAAYDPKSPELDELFPPRPTSMCSYCDFVRHCPEGRAAAPARDSWSGLADLPLD